MFSIFYIKSITIVRDYPIQHSSKGYSKDVYITRTFLKTPLGELRSVGLILINT